MLTDQEKTEIEPTWFTIIRLLRWDKPAGRFILMIPALWAVFLAAGGKPPIPLVSVIVLGSLATSAAGCVINDLWDRNIDPEVERTRSRPLAARALSIKVGVAVAFVAMSCAGILALYLNPLTFWLCVAAVPIIVFYPSAKRVLKVPQLVLSIAWGFAVLISWTAVTAHLEPAMWLLWGATVFWTLGFDTTYAMPDREDDRRLGINSSALFFSDRAAEAIGFFFAGTTVFLGWLGWVMHLHLGFWLALGVASFIWVWHYIRLGSADLLPSVYGEIFRQNVWIGFVLLAGMISGILI